jgi:prevent-host-death family protein
VGTEMAIQSYPFDFWRNFEVSCVRLQPVDSATYLANNQAMKMANIAEFKNNLSQFIAAVENGEEVEIRRRNLPIARVIPVTTRRANRTKLGCGRGTVKIVGNLTEPLIPEADWEMHEDGRS